MRFPSIFVNHGGGPLPLLGRQPQLETHMKEITSKWLTGKQKPDAIVVLSAHWESNPIQITSSANPTMLFDYHGFPPECYTYQYPAPGSPVLARKIQKLLGTNGMTSELNEQRGFDHGVFVPLMIMYPDADIPVVAVSLHASLSAEINMQIGKALSPLRDENILLLGSGYTYHNMHGFLHPSDQSYTASSAFNDWLKEVLLHMPPADRLSKLQKWDDAPGAKLCHPREEHLLPLLMLAAAAAAASSSDTTTPQLIFETNAGNGQHAVSSYLFP
jgi:4,5-DOPA dioxygenase extradiol